MTAVPARHPSRPLSVPAGITAFALLLGLKKPDAEQWRRLGEELTVGDEPMDQLVDWMSSAGMKEMRELFNRALDEGIDSVPEAPEPLRRFFADIERVPHWVNWDKIARGSAIMRSSGADGMYVARDVSLQGGYMFSGFNQTLLRTGALEKGSNQRFAETMQWAMDVISPGGLVPLGAGYRSTVRVRLIHSFVRRHVAAMPDWRDDEWGLPINQTDMAATLVGSLIAPAAGSFGMGLILKPNDAEAVAHLTRYVGWLMGVDDYWLPRSFRDAVRVLYHTSCALSAPDDTTKLLAKPMANDPLSWNYERLPGLRRRLARNQHLSLTAAFLGPQAMRTMGLPMFVLPWYPLLRIPVNMSRTAARHLPGGLERVANRGQREQAAFMKTIIAGDATIGASAAHIGRAA
ncbi:oxygenase MpaB family protein [Hoyosella altamirensis]|uniref:oxygenase MpaB family protein n=1 Tax=Hoyosella altamirensis TaxID=616997 RepID=UPI0007DAE786|nr:oxygenase MpaB family protein [Hoyosella altamirensis]